MTGTEKLDRPGSRPTAPRGAADPVKALMHRHRDLCARAVDALEIAAGLEAHGVTDRAAGRYRHRDVFSLAEEMYARVPRDAGTSRRPAPPSPAVPPLSAARPHAGWILRTLLPGALCAAVLAALPLAHGRTRLLVAVAGLPAVALALRAALSRGPLSPRTPRTGPPTPRRTLPAACWLVAYAVLGDGLLHCAVTGGPDGLPGTAPDAPWPLDTAPLLTLTLAVAPAAWCAHLFTAGARRRLADSRVLAEFATSVRPLLLGTCTLFLAALAGLAALTATALDEQPAHAEVLTLGALLLLARLLTVQGFTHAPGVVLTAAAGAQAVALASVFAARLPHCDALAIPVHTLLDAWGPGGVQVLACGAAALTLLVHANRTLTRASAHAPPERPW